MPHRRESLPVPHDEHTPALQSSGSPKVIHAKFFNTRNLAILVSGSVFIVALLKADSKDIPKIVETIVDSRRVAVVGWIVAVINLIASIVLFWILCKVYDKE